MKKTIWFGLTLGVLIAAVALPLILFAPARAESQHLSLEVCRHYFAEGVAEGFAVGYTKGLAYGAQACAEMNSTQPEAK